MNTGRTTRGGIVPPQATFTGALGASARAFSFVGGLALLLFRFTTNATVAAMTRRMPVTERMMRR